MANIVCAGCKTEIPETAEFCAECGYIVKSQAPVKCPECSNMVVFTSDACPECGFQRELPGEAPEPAVISDDSEVPPAALEDEVQPTPETFQPVLEPLTIESEDNVTSSDAEKSNVNVAEITALLNAQINSLNIIVDTISSITGSYDKTNTELINRIKEQNLLTLSGMQEVLSKFNTEFNKDTKVVKETNDASTQEIKSIATQAKEQIQQFASKISYKAGNTIDYTFFICAAILVFSVINLFVTAYVVKLMK